MLRIVSLVLLLALGSGCALRYYDITFSNGTTVGSKGKPKLVEGFYLYKDMKGVPRRVPEHRVSTIQPHTEKASQFNNYGAK